MQRHISLCVNPNLIKNKAFYNRQMPDYFNIFIPDGNKIYLLESLKNVCTNTLQNTHFPLIWTNKEYTDFNSSQSKPILSLQFAQSFCCFHSCQRLITLVHITLISSNEQRPRWFWNLVVSILEWNEKSTIKKHKGSLWAKSASITAYRSRQNENVFLHS